MSVTEHFIKRFFINDAAPCNIDDEAPLFHRAHDLLVNYMAGCGVEWNKQYEKIQIGNGGRQVIAWPPFIEEGQWPRRPRNADDVHSQRIQPRCKSFCNEADTENADMLAVERFRSEPIPFMLIVRAH